MWYVQIEKLPSEQTRRNLIEQALVDHSISVDDLIRKLGHVNISLGRVHLEALLQGEENRPLLRRIAALLQINTEDLIGERVFTDSEEYRRFVFAPKLLRIPEKTIPNQILPVILAGIDRFLCVGSYPEMLKIQPQYHDDIIGAMIRDDFSQNEKSIFGKIIGYAFQPSYDDMRAYDTDGRLLPNVVVTKTLVSAHAGAGSSNIGSSGGFICQLSGC